MVTSASGEVGRVTHFSYGDSGLADLLEYVSSLDLGTEVHILGATASPDRQSPLVRVVADTEQGITIDQIAHIARRLRDDDLLPEHLGVSDCRVEVTSPGVSYGLKQPWQFSRHVGRRLAIQIETPDEAPAGQSPPAGATDEVGSPANIEGQLIQSGPDGILLDVAGVHEHIAWKRIQQATVQLAW